MNAGTLEKLPIETLKNRFKLTSFAIFVLWAGAIFALAAVFYKYQKEGVLETTTLIVTIIAMALSIPVILRRKKLIRVIRERGA